MGASLQPSSRGSRGRGRRPMSDINVTPFVDVMLVLLVVFMITAPLLTAGVTIDLPNSEAKPIADEDNKPLEISLSPDGKIFVGEQEVEQERLVPLLSAITKDTPDRRIFIRADKSLDYGDVMSVLGGLNAAGFRKIALLSEQK
ncbi:MAG: protein TolR [Pseudomonadota bacterium]|nr:protein TolR [Pseudomonadota bacterium]